MEENDFLEVTMSDSAIIIKKAIPKSLCAITGKVVDQSEMKLIGNA